MTSTTIKPLVVDLDGTLIYTDMLHESAIMLFKNKPLKLLSIILTCKSKSILKHYLADNTEINPQTLPYNEELLSWLKEQRAQGRALILCTASDKKIAEKIANYLKIFDDVIASEGVTNLIGEEKARILVQRFGCGGFDYVGDSIRDLSVWSCAGLAIIVNASDSVLKKAAKIPTIQQIFPRRTRNILSWTSGLRVHQWLKNILIFIPLIAAHDVEKYDAWFSLFLGFVAFSLCASSVYICNDLIDLESDRLHVRKRDRPFASGGIPIWQGVLVAPLLLLLSLVIANLVGNGFLYWITAYYMLTWAYTWKIKQIILFDCFTLATLYTIRIISGAAAVGNSLSFWILAFSIFIFLSLSFVKRYAELTNHSHIHSQKLHGRGYQTEDLNVITIMGVVAGYSSVLVLAFYLNSDNVIRLYPLPEIIWGAVLIVLFWISWIWIQAHRGNMHDDPLIFAIKDRVSLFSGVGFMTIFIIGALGVPW